MTVIQKFKEDLIANVLALTAIATMILALVFYTPAIRNNFSPIVIVFGIIAVILLAESIFLNKCKGFDILLATFFSAYCFGCFLIGRLESINLIQVNLSDINAYFYVDIVLFSVTFLLVFATSVIKKAK